MTSQPGTQTIAVHILPNISRSKGHKKMKLGKLVEYNMKTHSLKLIHKMCGKTILKTLF